MSHRRMANDSATVRTLASPFSVTYEALVCPSASVEQHLPNDGRMYSPAWIRDASERLLSTPPACGLTATSTCSEQIFSMNRVCEI